MRFAVLGEKKISLEASLIVKCKCHIYVVPNSSLLTFSGRRGLECLLVHEEQLLWHLIQHLLNQATTLKNIERLVSLRKSHILTLLNLKGFGPNTLSGNILLFFWKLNILESVFLLTYMQEMHQMAIVVKALQNIGWFYQSSYVWDFFHEMDFINLYFDEMSKLR